MSSSFKSNNKQNNKSNNYNSLTLEKEAKKKLIMKYGSRNKSSLKYQYLDLIMENLIFNKNSHLVTVFKDYMIWDYYDEFCKRFYYKKESTQRVPKFSIFYKNYLKFFCIPTLKDQTPNEMIHTCSEKKAELFYKENYQRKKKDNSELKDCGIYQDSATDEGESKINYNNNSKMLFFDENVKKKIERISPINTSIVLNDSETKLKEDESGLLITSSEIDSYNENSLRDIVKGMKKKKNKNLNQKLTLYANDYISSEILNKNREKNRRNKSLDLLSNIGNKNKQLTDSIYNMLKKEEKKKSNNYLINSSNDANKKKNISKLITSFNNNYNNSRNQSQNAQIIINSNIYLRSKNLDKINNIKKTINLNLLKTKNIQNILGKNNPSIYINSNNLRNPKIFYKNTPNKDNIANSAKSIFVKNEKNLKMTNYKYFFKNSSYSQSKLLKNNSTKTNRKTERILSYKNNHKSENESVKKNNNKNVINTKLSFDGLFHNSNNNININNNSNNNNNNKKYNIINYIGDKHVHSINININNHYNIGSKQYKQISTFSDLLKRQNKNTINIINKKSNIHTFLTKNNKNMNVISRNSNQNYGLNSFINNTKNNKMNSTNNIHNSLYKNSIYKNQYTMNKGKSETIYNFKQKKANKIKLANDNIFSY